MLSALSVSVSLTVCLDITADCHQRLSCVFCPVFLCSRFVSHFLSPLTPSRSLVAPLWAWFLPKVSPVKSDQLLYFSFTNHFVLLKEKQNILFLCMVNPLLSWSTYTHMYIWITALVVLASSYGNIPFWFFSPCSSFCPIKCSYSVKQWLLFCFAAKQSLQDFIFFKKKNYIIKR